MAQPRGDVGQRRGAQLVEQLLGVVRARREDDLVGGVDAGGAAAEPATRADRVDREPAAVEGTHPGHGGERVHLRSGRLGEGQVVGGEGVLGAVPAAGHALAALDATGALGAGAAEVGVGDGPARFLGAVAPEKDPDRGQVEGVGLAELAGQPLHLQVARRERWIGDDPEHLLRLGVVRRQLVAPVGDVRPLRVVVEGLQRLVERVRVVERAATHPGPGQDQAVLEQVDPLDAGQAQLGCPDEVAQLPGVPGQGVGGEPPAGLEDPDAVALLGEPQGGDAAPEAGPDHQHVVVGHCAPTRTQDQPRRTLIDQQSIARSYRAATTSGRLIAPRRDAQPKRPEM